MNAENFTIDISKIPRIVPTSPFRSIQEFFLYEKSKKVMFYKTVVDGNVVNLNPFRIKNVFKPVTLG